MSFDTKYNPTVSFPVKSSKVYQLSKATEAVPASYRLTYDIIGRNLGSTLTIEDTYYFYDNLGIPFTVFAVGSGTIDVYDQFNTGECPINGKNGIIVKSVWSGRAPIVSYVNLQYLHPLAVFNINKWNLDILWANDSNGVKIPFTASDSPSIEDYQIDQVNLFGVIVNYQNDYGDMVGAILVEEKTDDFTGDIIQAYRPEQPTMVMVDNKISRIYFGIFDPVISGFILLFRRGKL